MTSAAEKVDLSKATPELLPCPFCGGPASFGGGKHKYVACRNEECFGPMTTAVDPDESATQWNTRAVNERDELIQALREARDYILNEPHETDMAPVIDRLDSILERVST